MVDPRDDNRENFTIDDKDPETDAAGLHAESYFGNASNGFSKKSIVPFVIGGLGLVVLIVVVIRFIATPQKVDRNELQSLETRIRQLEKQLPTREVPGPDLGRMEKQEAELKSLEKKLNRLESTVTIQIDQIIKEIGLLHQKTAQKAAVAAPKPKKSAKQQQAASPKPDSTTKIHLVQSGETLYRISRRYGLTVDQLKRYNNLEPNAAIYPGQKLKLVPNEKP